MSNKPKLVPALSLLAFLLVPATSFARTNDRAPCILQEHRITTVTPYRINEQHGRASVQRLRGASIFVQAEPGLTGEWLQLKLQRQLAAMRGSASMPDCVFDLDKVRVRVESGGTGFWVRIIAADTQTGQEVLRRAELLVG